MNLTREADYLRLLRYTTKDQRIALIKTITPHQLKAVIEVFLNIYHMNVSASPACIKQLAKQKRFILRLIAKESSRDTRRKILIRLESLLPLIIKQVLHLL